MVNIGEDEFCTNCMEWRKYDKEGKCVVCGKPILKKVRKDEKDSYSKYENGTFDVEETEEE